MYFDGKFNVKPVDNCNKVQSGERERERREEGGMERRGERKGEGSGVKSVRVGSVVWRGYKGNLVNSIR